MSAERRPSFAIERRLDVTAREVAALSWSAIDRPLGHDAELTLSTIAGTTAASVTTSAVLLGRFQRLADAATFHPELPRLRRASGGTHLLLTPGSLHLSLALARPEALVACTPVSLMNRYVRPVLRATGGAYFGRDWIAGAKIPGQAARRPAAFVGFAHHAATSRAVFEVVLPAMSEGTDWCDPSRPSHRGAPLGSFASPARLVEAIITAYEDAYGPARPLSTTTSQFAPPADPTPWTATVDEAMGPLRAGPDETGNLTFGGELFASVDRVDSLARAVQAAAAAGTHPTVADLSALVDAAFADGRGIIVGVASLASVRDVLRAALSRA